MLLLRRADHFQENRRNRHGDTQRKLESEDSSQSGRCPYHSESRRWKRKRVKRLNKFWKCCVHAILAFQNVMYLFRPGFLGLGGACFTSRPKKRVYPWMCYDVERNVPTLGDQLRNRFRKVRNESILE
jgi:hypothetical protein